MANLSINQRRLFSKAALQSGFCQSQTSQLDSSLTLVDHNDNVIGSVSKLDGHLRDKIVMGRPHRAFSLFLFNTQNQLLLQQRSLKKITFPGLWTNTCCSHPEHTPDEMDTSHDYIGARRATIRRTKFEMGIDLNLLDLQCGARILYYAEADTKFAEYELDYIIFAKTDVGSFQTNNDEVQNHQYVSLRDIDDFLDERKSMNQDITPWFRLIHQTKLREWWKHLKDVGSFPNQADTIIDFVKV